MTLAILTMALGCKPAVVGEDAPESWAPNLGWTRLSLSPYYGCALDVYGAVHCSGTVDGLTPFGFEPEQAFLDITAADFDVACGRAEGDRVTCFGPTGWDVTESMLDAPTEPMASLAAGVATMCGVRSSDGLPLCWGWNGNGLTENEPDVPLREISVADWVSCGLGREDGRIVCWGDDNVPELLAPPAGSYRTLDLDLSSGLAIAEDGSLVFWGNNAWGDTSNIGFGVDDVPTGSFVKVSIGGWFHGRHLGIDELVQSSHACAIDDATDLVCWGDDRFGATDPPALGPGWTDVDVDGLGSCGIHSGRIHCWGTFLPGQILPPE